ncbi:MAG: hypothetical protein AAF641_17105 [Pseudomonadota bacterium]
MLALRVLGDQAVTDVANSKTEIIIAMRASIAFRRLIKLVHRRFFRRRVVEETPLGEREGYETVFDDDVMKVLHIRGRKEECIVSFTGVGHALGGLDLQNPEFARSDGDEIKIFVIDKQRSWGNSLNWEKLKEIVDCLAPDAQITTIGNSMGGFLAILSLPVFGAKKAVAFVPQWSIDPSIVPGEDRWLRYRNEIKHIIYPDLTNAVRTQAKIYTFFGKDGKDGVHLQFFSNENLEAIVLEDCGHNAAAYLKKHGMLYPVLNACRDGADIKTLLREANIRVF